MSETHKAKHISSGETHNPSETLIEESAFLEACKEHCRIANHGMAHPVALRGAIKAYLKALPSAIPLDKYVRTNISSVICNIVLTYIKSDDLPAHELALRATRKIMEQIDKLPRLPGPETQQREISGVPFSILKSIIDAEKARCVDDDAGRNYKLACENIWAAMEVRCQVRDKAEEVSSYIQLIEHLQAELKSANNALKRESGDRWQPIETAPIDGTRILGTDGQMIEVIYNARGTGWFNQSAEISLWQTWPPTHWMPLPEPPTTSIEV